MGIIRQHCPLADRLQPVWIIWLLSRAWLWWIISLEDFRRFDKLSLYKKNHYNTGVQLQKANFESLYPIVYLDLRENKENLTNEPKQLAFHYKYGWMRWETHWITHAILAAVLYEEEIASDTVGRELVVVWSLKNLFFFFSWLNDLLSLTYHSDGLNLSTEQK